MAIRSRCAALVCLSMVLVLPEAAQVSGPRPVRPPAVRRVPSEYATIQGAIDAAHDGDVVVVAAGTYAGTIDFRGKKLEVVAWEGAGVTTLQGTQEDAVVRFHSGEGPDSRLIGFTIREGLCGDDTAGGVSGADPHSSLRARAVLSDCIIEDNFSDQDFGIGAAGVSGELLLERCILRRNQSFVANEPGGGHGALTLVQCVVEENMGCGGGGLLLESGAHVFDCLLRANQAGPCFTREGPLPTHGGAIRIAGPGVVIEGSILIGNRVNEGADFGGGGCVSQSRGGALWGEALLERCTLVDNVWVDCAFVGGILGSPELRDCIVYDNADPLGFYANQGFRYSDVQGGAAGPGSFDAHPVLVEHAPGDVRLGPGSPCIDRGDPLSPLDPDGTRADLGARHRPQGAPALGVVWRERDPLRASAPDVDLGFGKSVAAQGDTLLVGTTPGEFVEGPHSVQVLRRVGGAWVEQQRLESGELFDSFGWSVDLDGDVAVVGALSADDVGAVHVFERDTPSAPFEHTVKLPRGSFHFGSAIALSGRFLAVGADIDGLGRGSATLFHRLARGRWEQVARFRAPEGDGWLASSFGSAVALEGDTLVVGAPMEGADTYPGGAFVYQRAGSSPQAWTLVRALAASDPVDGARFGQTVAVGGDTILVGAKNGVYAFERRGPGLPWSEAQKLVPASGLPGFGSDVVLDGNRAWFTRGWDIGSLPELWEFSRANAGAPWSEAVRVVFPPRSVGADSTNALAFTEGTLFVGGGSGPAGEYEVRRLTRGPEVLTLALDQAADEEPVTLTGRGLAAVTRVLVGGEEVPIVSQDSEHLVLQPPRRAPGFASLRLESTEGDLELASGWHAAPTLASHTSGLGGRLEVELENGAAGAYVLLWSFDRRAHPLPLLSPPTWFGLELRSLPGRFGQLALDAFTSSGRATRGFDLPSDPSLVGLPFHLQAWCQRGLIPPTRHSFSNTQSLAF